MKVVGKQGPACSECVEDAVAYRYRVAYRVYALGKPDQRVDLVEEVMELAVLLKL